MLFFNAELLQQKYLTHKELRERGKNSQHINFLCKTPNRLLSSENAVIWVRRSSKRCVSWEIEREREKYMLVKNMQWIYVRASTYTI